MINHGENLPTKNTKQNQKLADDLDEKCLAEMLFYMEQLRRLIRKYDKVVKKYYVQYLSGYDIIEFKESIQVHFYIFQKILFLSIFIYKRFDTKLRQ